MKSNLIRIYEELIDRDAEGILQKLEECSSIYSLNIEYEQGENSKNLIYALRNLENVNAADAYMLLMFLEKLSNIFLSWFANSISSGIFELQFFLSSNYFLRSMATYIF